MLNGSGSSCSRLDGRMRAAQPPLAADKADWRKEEGPHPRKRSLTSHLFKRLGKREKKPGKTAVFTHFRQLEEILSPQGLLAPLHPLSRVMLRARADTLIYTKLQKLIYVQSDILLHTITATIIQRVLGMTDGCPLNSVLYLHTSTSFHLLLI